jgi:putative membrane protein
MSNIDEKDQRVRPKIRRRAKMERYNDGLLDVVLKKLDKGQLKQIFTYDIDSWFEILFAIQGRSMPWLPWISIMTLTTFFILIDDKFEYSILGKNRFNKSVNGHVHSTFGLVLGFLLVHQSVTCCNRWWKGRVAWENIITNTREAVRIICCHANGKEIIKLFGKYTIAFSITSKHYLRQETFTKTDRCPQLARVLPRDDLDRLYNLSVRNRPLACLYAAQRISEMSIKKGLYTRPIARDINPRLVTLANQLGICEAILYSPLPWVYTLHLRFVLTFFLILTPLAMFEEDPLPSQSQIYVFMAVISYAFLGLEDMAMKIQNPFGLNPSDLPLEIFTFIAYRDVKDIIDMKYRFFGKDYTNRLLQLGKDEIASKKFDTLIIDEEGEDDGGDD